MAHKLAVLGKAEGRECLGEGQEKSHRLDTFETEESRRGKGEGDLNGLPEPDSTQKTVSNRIKGS